MMMLRLVVQGCLVTLLSGCLFVSEGYLGEVFDADSDGFDHSEHGGNDCDDNDPNVGGSILYYVDADGDGFGDAQSEGEALCELTQDDGSLVANKTDCNDTDSEVNPEAIELCANGIDDDCNGVVDDDC